MVKIYICRADVYGTEFENIMTKDRIEKYRRLKIELGQRHCVASARLLKRAFPDAVKYDISPAGKLSLPGHDHFSLSHSGDYAVLAVSERPVGVDIEKLKQLNYVKTAVRVFSGDRLGRLNLDPSPECFFRLWTEYESFFKRFGRTLSAEDDDYTGFLYPRSPDGYCITVCTDDTGCETEYID